MSFWQVQGRCSHIKRIPHADCFRSTILPRLRTEFIIFEYIIHDNYFILKL